MQLFSSTASRRRDISFESLNKKKRELTRKLWSKVEMLRKKQSVFSRHRIDLIKHRVANCRIDTLSCE